MTYPNKPQHEWSDEDYAVASVSQRLSAQSPLSQIGQQPRPEWEQQFPDYMLLRFDLWRAGIRDWRASDPAAYEPRLVEQDLSKGGGKK